jgi:hypothetical protein
MENTQMAKTKADTATTTDGLEKFAAILADMTPDQQTALATLTDEEKVAKLEFLLSIQSSAVFANDVEFLDVKPVKENIEILTAGGMGLTAGTRIRAFLLGTVHVYTKDFKPNWKIFTSENGATYYYNSYIKFQNVQGIDFGIWNSPTLRMLEKVPTNAALPELVKSNPLVEVNYVGKIEGRERLSKEFGIELRQGNSAHVFQPKIAAGVKYDSYVKGCVNSLNSPFPIERAEAGSVSRDEATRSNYEKLMALQNNGSTISASLAN